MATRSPYRRQSRGVVYNLLGPGVLDTVEVRTDDGTTYVWTMELAESVFGATALRAKFREGGEE